MGLTVRYCVGDRLWALLLWVGSQLAKGAVVGPEVGLFVGVLLWVVSQLADGAMVGSLVGPFVGVV